MNTTRTTWIGVLTLSAALALAACGKKEETPGEKLDSAIAKTEQKAEEVKADVQAGANSAENSAAQAGDKIEAAADKAGEKIEGAADKVGTALDDAGITTAVNAELAKDKDLSALKINVDTSAGKVTLKGTAPSAAAKDHATALAQGVKGVTSVDNQLTIGK